MLKIKSKTRKLRKEWRSHKIEKEEELNQECGKLCFKVLPQEKDRL